MHHLSSPKITGLLKKTALLFIFLAGVASVSYGQIYVDKSASGANDGTSWANAYTSLQDALTDPQTESGSAEIRIAEGVYHPDEGSGISDGNRDTSFTIQGDQDGLKIYGGYPAGGGQRNLKEHVTVLSGDVGGDDTDPDGDGVIEDANDINGGNSYHVLVFDGGTRLFPDVAANITRNTVLDGLIVTAGQANGSRINDQSGGGLFCDGEGTNNECSPTLKNIIFAGNRARRGGAIVNFSYSTGESSPRIVNAVFMGNRASGLDFSEGGAIRNVGSDNAISSPSIFNSTFIDNHAENGGAIQSYGSGATPSITNSILYGNTAGQNGDEVRNTNSASTTISYSLVEGGYSGSNNLDINPEFYRPHDPNGLDNRFFTNDDGFRLTQGSPLLNVGNNGAIDDAGQSTLVETDITGGQRILDGTVDLGAYEGANHPVPLHVSPGASGDCYSWTDACSLQHALANADQYDTIVLKKGTYTPGSSRGDSFTITGDQDGLKIYGGWNGNETFYSRAEVQAQLDGRDLVAHRTILSGDIDGDDARFDPTADSDNDSGTRKETDHLRGGNSYHILFLDGRSAGEGGDGPPITRNTVLDGLTVTSGQGDESESNFFREGGGGLLCDGTGGECSPTLSKINFVGSVGKFGGAANFYVTRGVSGTVSPHLTDVVFYGNSAPRGGLGGAIQFLTGAGAGRPVITESTFALNHTFGAGGAIYSFGSSGTIYEGRIMNTTFAGNTCGTRGRAIALNGGHLTLTNVVISGAPPAPTSDGYGTEIYNYPSGTLTLGHTLLSGGKKDIYNDGGVTNYLDGSGNAVSFSQSTNLDADPGYLRAAVPAGGDGIFGTKDDGLHLTADSPALNAGINDSVKVSTDLTGDQRIQDGTVDLGAYEGGIQPRIYVDADAAPGGDGSSWGSAYANLQDALAAAGGGNVIWVAEGVYKPGSSETSYFTITGAKNGLQIYGGFSGTETRRSQRDPSKHRTILSGDIGGDDTDPDGDGIIKHAADINGSNNYHVLVLDGSSGEGPITKATVLDGLSVTAGQADNQISNFEGRGAGLYCDGSGDGGVCSPTLRNLVFAGNNAYYVGGAICNYTNPSGTTSPLIANSIFIGNSSTSSAGGALVIYAYTGRSLIHIRNTAFIENSAKGGGAIVNLGSLYTSRLELTNVIFEGNTAASGSDGGGAIWNYGNNSTNIITLTNVIFWGNRADNDGSGNQIWNYGSSTVTMTHTLTEGGTGGISTQNGATTTYLDDSGASVTFANSTNFDSDPQFLNPSKPAGDDGVFGTSDDGMRLLSGSPALNAGTNDSVAVSTDLVGADRIQNTTVDLGAYEGPYLGSNRVTIRGSEGWRMMSSPKGGLSYAALLDTLWLQGMTGGDVTDGTPNLYTWNESTQQFEAVTDASSVPAAGQGFLVYVYNDQDQDGTDEGFPKTIPLEDPRGGGTISAPLSYDDYTEAGAADTVGFNLVGNPYGVTIDWDSPELTKTNLNAPFYVWSDSANAGTGAYLSWNGSAGTLPDGLIAPWQGFWVQASGASPSLQFSDGARTDGGALYKKPSGGQVPQITFTLKGPSMESHAVVMLSKQAKPGKDRLDAWKLQSLNKTYLSLYTTDTKRHALDINALPRETDSPLKVHLDFRGSDPGGTYTLHWNPQALPKGSVTLTDRHTDKVLKLNKDGEYSFKVRQASSSGKANKQSSQSSRPQHIQRPDGGPIPTVFKAKARNPRFVLTITPKTASAPTGEIPKTTQLDQNYPNPFNPTTVIRYGVPKKAQVRLTVYDVLGRRVRTLINEQKSPGHYKVSFDGSKLASGLYFYRLKVGAKTLIKKMTLIK